MVKKYNKINCASCGIDVRTKYWNQKYCRPCSKIEGREKTKEKKKEYEKGYYLKNKKKLIEYQNKYRQRKKELKRNE